MTERLDDWCIVSSGIEPGEVTETVNVSLLIGDIIRHS